MTWIAATGTSRHHPASDMPAFALYGSRGKPFDEADVEDELALQVIH